MARIRSIKPGFFASEDVSALPLRARLTWIGLWTQCDDQGRAKDNAKLIKAAIWPLDAVNLADIEEDLITLADHGRIVRYEVDGKRYLEIVNWHDHQVINKKTPSKLPPPPPDLPESSGSPTGELPEDSGTAPSGKGKEGKGNPPTPQGGKRGSRRAAYDYDQHPDFSRFWQAYPQKSGKAEALRAFLAAIERGHDPNVIIKAAERYRNDPQRNPEMTKHPQGWLNSDRFLDEAANGTHGGGGWWDN